MVSDTEVRLTLRLPADLYSELAARAKREERSINGQITYLLRQALDIPKSESVRRHFEGPDGSMTVDLGAPGAD